MTSQYMRNSRPLLLLRSLVCGPGGGELDSLDVGWCSSGGRVVQQREVGRMEDPRGGTLPDCERETMLKRLVDA